MEAKQSAPLHVLVVTAYYPAHRGGIERVADELRKAWQARGDTRVTWFASDCDPAPEGAENLTIRPAGSLNWIEQRFSLPWPVWSPLALLSLRRAVQAATVVHVHDYIYMGSIAAAAFAIIARKPLVITQHIGMIPYERGWMRWLLSTLNRTIGRWMLSRADAVVFESQVVQDYFSELVRFERALCFIPNGVNQALFRPLDEQTRRKARESFLAAGRQILCLFVGRFVEKKGLPVLQALTNAFPDVQWVMLGSGPIDPLKWGAPNLRVHAPVPPRELARFYQAADLLVLPSKGEGFPLVVQEAMACGTPVMVGLDTAEASPGSRQLLFAEDAQSEDAVSRWTRRLRQILAHPDTLLGMRNSCAAHAHSNWSWAVSAERYVQLFTAAARKRAP